MGLATQRKNTPSQSADDEECSLVGWERPFFAEIMATAEVTRKEIKYGLRVSHTYVDEMLNGTKPNPFSRAREACELLHLKKRPDVVMTVLVYIAGVAFDGRILSAAQVDAIRELAKAVEPLK